MLAWMKIELVLNLHSTVCKTLSVASQSVSWPFLKVGDVIVMQSHNHN